MIQNSSMLLIGETDRTQKFKALPFFIIHTLVQASIRYLLHSEMIREPRGLVVESLLSLMKMRMCAIKNFGKRMKILSERNVRLLGQVYFVTRLKRTVFRIRISCPISACS